MFKDRRTAMVGTLVLALFLLSLTLTNPGKALADTFLKIDGIKGESQDSKHKDEIDVISWGFGETNPAAVARSGGGARSGPVNMQDFKFTMRTNAASPKLFEACASGQHLREAMLVVRSRGDKGQEFLKITLSEVLVSSFLNFGSSGASDYPAEEIQLNFAKIKIEYYPTKPGGTLGGSIPAGWDVPSNKKF